MEHIGGKRGRSDGNTDDNDNDYSEESRNSMTQFNKVSVNNSYNTNNNNDSTTVNLFNDHKDDSPSWSSSSSTSPSSSLQSGEQIDNNLSEKEQQEHKEEEQQKMTNASHEIYDADSEHTTLEQASLSPCLAVSVNKVSEYTNCVVQELAKVNGNVINSLLSEWNNSQQPLQEMYKTQQEIMKYILSTQREHIKSILNLKHTTEVSDMQNKVIAILQEYFTSKESMSDKVANDSITISSSSSDRNLTNIVSLLWNRLSTYLQGPLQFMQQQLTSEREYNNELASRVHYFLINVFDEVNRHATRALHAKLESTAKDVQLAKLQSAYFFEQAQSTKQAAELHAMQKIVNELSKEHERAEQNEANAARYKNYLTNVERELEFKSIVASHIDKDEELHELNNSAKQRNSFIEDNDDTVSRANKVYKTEAAASIAAAQGMRRRYHSVSEQSSENTTPLIQPLSLQNNYNNKNTESDRNDNTIVSKDEKGAALRSSFDFDRWNAVKSAAPEFFALRLLAHANITLSELIDDWITQEKRILRATCECNTIHEASMRVRHDALVVHQLYQSEKQRRERVEERLNHILREHAEIGAFMNNKNNNNNKNMYYLMRQDEIKERRTNKVRQEPVHAFDNMGEYATLQEVPLVIREMQSLQTECNAAKDDAVHLSVLLQLAREEVNKAQDINTELRDQIRDLENKLHYCTVAQELDALRTDMNNKWRSLENEFVDVQSQLRLMTSLAEERNKECEQVQMEMERCREENSKLREQLLQSNWINKHGSSNKNSEEMIVKDYLHSMGNATQQVMNIISALNSRIALSDAKLDRTSQEKEKQYTIFNEQLTKFMESCEHCVQEFTSLAHPIYTADSNTTSQTLASSTTTNANNCDAYNIVNIVNNEKEAVPESATYLQWCAREQIELLQSAFRHSVEFLTSFVSHSLNERSLSTQVLLRDGQCVNELQNELHAAQYNEANLQQQLKSALDLVERHHLHLVQDVLMHEITPHTEITESHMLQENSQLSEQMATLTTELETTRATSTSTLTELQKLTSLKEEMQNNLLDEQTRRTLSDLYVDKLTTLLQESYARERMLSAENVQLHKEKEEMTTRVVAQTSDATKNTLVTQIDGVETSSLHSTEQEQEQQPEQIAATLQELLIRFDQKLENINSVLAKCNRSQETETSEKATQNKSSMPMTEAAERNEEPKNSNMRTSSLEAMPIPSESELALQLAKGGMSTIVQLIRSVLVKAQLVQDAVETSALQTTLAIAASTAEMYGDGSKEGNNVVVNVSEDHENSELSNEERANVEETSDQLGADTAITTKIAAGIEDKNKTKDSNMEDEEERERALQLTRLAKRVELLEHEITMASAEKEAITTRLHNAEAHSAKAEENNRRMLDITKTLLEKQQRLIAENKTLKEQLANANLQSNAMKEIKNVDNEANVNVSNESNIVTANDDDRTNNNDEESEEENKNVNNGIETRADNATTEVARTTNGNEGIESINENTNADQHADIDSTYEEVLMTNNEDKNENVSDAEEKLQHELAENV